MHLAYTYLKRFAVLSMYISCVLKKVIRYFYMYAVASVCLSWYLNFPKPLVDLCRSQFSMSGVYMSLTWGHFTRGAQTVKEMLWMWRCNVFSWKSLLAEIEHSKAENKTMHVFWFDRLFVGLICLFMTENCCKGLTWWFWLDSVCLPLEKLKGKYL